MGHGFYDITLYYHSKGCRLEDFNVRQNLVSGLYVSFLGNYKPKGITKISVEVGNTEHESWHFGSILTAYTKLDDEAYWNGSPAEQNQIILYTIHRVAISCADKYDWDKSIFEAAYQKVLECGFIFEQEQQRKFSKDKQHQACLLLERDGRAATISVRFYNKDGEFIKTVELLKTLGHVAFYGKLLKNSKWFNNKEFGVYGKDGELVIKASIDTLNPETIINPKVRSRDVIEGDLRNISYNVTAREITET